MRTLAPHLVAAGILVLAGCRTSAPPTAVVAPPEAASAASVPGPSTNRPTAPPGSLASLVKAIEFNEELKGDRRLAIPGGAHLADLDYKSRLSITPRRQELESMSSPGGPVLPALAKDDEARLEQISAWTRVASDYVNQAQRINDEVRQARARDNLAADQVKALQDRIRAQASMGQKVVRQIRELAEAKAKARLGANADQDKLDEEVARETRKFFEDETGKDVILNVKAFAQFLTQEMQFGLSVATNDVATVEREGTTRLRIRAWVVSRGKEPLAAHVENYDNIEDPMPPKDPRVSFKMNDSERERVERGYRVASDAAQLIRDVKSKESSLRQGFNVLLQTTRGDLNRLRNDLTRLNVTASALVPAPLAALLTNAVTLVRNSANVDDATKNQVALLLNDIQALSQQKTNLLSLVELANRPSSQDLLQTFSSLSDTANEAATAITTFPLTLQTNVNRLKLLSQALGSIQGPEAAAMVSSLTSALLPETTQKVGELVDLFKTSYPNLSAELADLITRAPTAALATEIDDARLDPRVKPLALDQLAPGSVNLDNLPADRGDKLRVKSELIIPSGGQEQIIESERTFAIDRYGWTSGFSAQLAFVNRQGSGEDFVPAPAVSWTLHYRLRERQRTGWGSKTWSFLDPGFGVNTAALSFDNNFEVGVGAHLTLFSDLLQGGYGYNLNVSGDHGYFFVGIGILEALDGVGNLFKQVRSNAGGK